MALIADGLLIATCLTAALYCFVLSRRLRNLTNTEDGIGKQILQMNTSLEETRTVLKDLRGTSKSASDRLAREIQNARRCVSELEALVARAGEITSPTYQDAAPVSPAPEQEPTTANQDTVDPDFDDEDLEDVAGFVGEEQLGFAPDGLEALPSEPVEAPRVVERPSSSIDAVQEEPDSPPTESTSDLSAASDTSAPEDEHLIRVERMAL